MVEPKQPEKPLGDDADWGELVEVWRDESEGDSPDELAATWMKEEASMITSTRKLIFKFVMEFVAGFVVVAFYAFLLQRDTTPYLVAIAAASTMFLLVYLSVLTHLFWKTFRPDAHTTEAYLALKHRRLEAGVRWASFVQLSSACFGGFIALWALWFVLGSDDPLRMLRGVSLPLVGVYAILGGVLYFARKDARKKAAELGALLSLSES